MIRLAIAVRNARLQAIAAQVDGAGEGASLTLYRGAAPGSADTAAAEDDALATLAIPPPFAAAIDNGVLTAVALPEVMASGTGQATWCRLRDGAGAAVLDMSVGTADAGHPVTLPDDQVYAGMLIRGVSLIFTES